MPDNLFRLAGYGRNAPGPAHIAALLKKTRFEIARGTPVGDFSLICIASGLATYPGMIGKGYADLRDLPLGGTESGSFGNWPVIASDLEVDPCRRYDSAGQDERRPI